jgi:hypothetical protein
MANSPVFGRAEHSGIAQRYRDWHVGHTSTWERLMNDDAFNLSIRKFLKMVGVSSQREIEHAIGAALQEGKISGTESFPCRMTLEVEGVKLRVVYDGTIDLT